jgi:hypothetical protein
VVKICDFFSFVTDGEKRYYFDWALRQKCLSGELNYNPDSHTSIADYFGFKGEKEDTLNKYEFNPLTGIFNVDQLNGKDDRLSAEAFARALDFKTIIPQLIIKPIVLPFTIENKVEQADIDNLKKWASVVASVRVGASVVASVGASVGDSVGASVRDSVSSFFDIKYDYDFTPCIELRNRGFVPSFDGKSWRLHGKAGIVYEDN